MTQKEIDDRIDNNILSAAKSSVDPLNTIAQLATLLRLDKSEVYRRVSALVADGRMVLKVEDDGNHYYVAGHEQNPSKLKTINPFQLSMEDRQNKILEAIDAKKRTIAMIYEFTGWPQAYDLTELIGELAIQKVVRIVERGHITAIFRYDQMPTRIWHSGERTIEAEFEAGFVPRDEQAIAEQMDEWKRAEPVSEQDEPEPAAEVIPDESLERTIEPAPEARQHQVDGRRKQYAHLSFTEQEIADLGAKYGSVTVAAKSLGYATLSAGSTGLHRFLRSDRKLKAAFDRGAARFKESEAGMTAIEVKPNLSETEIEPAPVVAPVVEEQTLMNTESVKNHAKSVKSREVVTPDALEELAAEYGTVRLVAEHLGYKVQSNGISGLNALLTRWPDLKGAFERGRARYLTERAGSEAIEQKAEIIHEPVVVAESVQVPAPASPTSRFPSRIVMEIDESPEVDQSLLRRDEAVIQPMPSHTKSIPLSAGNLVIGFDGNFFDMSAADREKLMKIADILQNNA